MLACYDTPVFDEWQTLLGDLCPALVPIVYDAPTDPDVMYQEVLAYHRAPNRPTCDFREIPALCSAACERLHLTEDHTIMDVVRAFCPLNASPAHVWVCASALGIAIE